MSLNKLPDIVIEPIVRLALSEDFGVAGDITARVCIPEETQWRAAFVARQTGVLAGMDAARLALRLVDPGVTLDEQKRDGDRLIAGDVIAVINGRAQSILAAERVMLNFLGRMSGIASLARQFADLISDLPTRVTCTRKTTPGLRALEKQAAALGGCVNHRFSLADAILIKDNHIAAIGGVSAALARAKAVAGHMRVIEIEVDTLDQLREALPFAPHAVLLDNMSVPQLREAVALTRSLSDHRIALEASGGVTLARLRDIAETGVDYISSGAITHSAPNFDIGLDDL